MSAIFVLGPALMVLGILLIVRSVARFPAPPSCTAPLPLLRGAWPPQCTPWHARVSALRQRGDSAGVCGRVEGKAGGGTHTPPHNSCFSSFTLRRAT